MEESAWYGTEQEGVLRDAVELGLFHGVGGDRFSPDRALTLAETVKLAAVVRSTYCGDGHRFDRTAGTHWYDTYLDYAVEQGILTGDQFPGAGPYGHPERGGLSPVPRPPGDRTAAAEHPLSPGCNSGGPIIIMRSPGSTRQACCPAAMENGTFHGGSTLTRAQAAAILVRLALPDRRATDK